MKALITGSAAGLGQAFEQRLTDLGWTVTGLDKKTGATITADLSQKNLPSPLKQQLSEHGPYDLAILNAGINATGKFEDIPWRDHQRVLAVNTFAPINIANHLLDDRLLSGGSRLLFISSLSNAVGYPGAASYAASKDAIAAYASSLRKALKRRKISVSTAFPGPLRTDHAERHAPPGADPSKRMPADDAARRILEACFKGKARIYPGAGAKGAAVAGTMAPHLVTKAMKRAIYDRFESTT